MDLIPWYITSVRILVPFIILRFPLMGIFASMFVDASDWKFIDVTNNANSIVYQNWDKIMDLYYWLFIILVVKSWKDVWVKRMAIGLFSYRLIGMVWFWVTDWRSILFFFPNIFENFVIVCLIIFYFSKDKYLKISFLQKNIMLSVLIFPKLIHEYFQHFLLRQPWEIIDIGKWLGFTDPIKEHVNNISWGGILYVIPVLGFLVYIKLNRRFL